MEALFSQVAASSGWIDGRSLQRVGLAATGDLATMDQDQLEAGVHHGWPSVVSGRFFQCDWLHVLFLAPCQRACGRDCQIAPNRITGFSRNVIFSD